jgi:adenine phosphoribosyltransferase
MHELERFIRDIPDFPKPGIIFKDITPILTAPEAFSKTMEELKQKAEELNPDLILGIESRGFIFGGALALMMKKGFIIARKPGKLPYEKDSVSYELEYGSNTLELHRDAIKAGQRVLILDDLLATGGTASACAQLVRNQEGIVAGHLFVIELGFLEGRKKLESDPVASLVVY